MTGAEPASATPAGDQAAPERSWGGRLAKLRRLSLGVVDQLVSSGSNFLAMVLAARLLTVDGFGAFSLALLTYGVALGIVRSLCCEAILVRPGVDRTDVHLRATQTIGSAMALSLLVLPVVAGLGLLLGGDVRLPMLVLALALPALVLQDALRHVAFARRQPAIALASDVSWLVGQLVGFSLIALVDDPSAALVVTAWAVPSVIGAAVSMVRMGVRPGVSLRLTWIRRNRDLSLRYLIDFVSGQGAGQVAVYAVAAVAGLGAVAGVRGAQTLFGAVVVLQTGSYTVLVPELQRTAQTAPWHVLRLSRFAGIAFTIIALVATLAFHLLPDLVGTAILGATWPAAHALVIPIGLAAAASGLLAGASIGLRALSAADAIVRVRFFTTPAILALPMLGAILGGAEGAGYGIFAASAWSCLWYWHAIRSVVAHRSAPGVLVA